MKVLNIGIIGFGGMAAYHHQCLKSHDKYHFVGVFDVNPHRMLEAEKLGLKAYPSKDALLSDAAIDLVLIATTNEVHAELAQEAMRMGKHVLCEKPVTLNSKELMDTMAVAKATQKIFSINQNRRTNKDFILVKRAYEQHLIGDVYKIESRVEGSRGMPSGWRTLKALGGGMMLDWGVHLIDQLLYLIDSPVSHVYCKMLSLEYPEVDDNFQLHLTFENSIDAQIEVATNNYITHPRWYVLGKNGSLQVNSWDCDGSIVRCIDKDSTWQDDIVYTKAGPTKTMAPRRPESTETILLSEPMDVIDHLSVVYDNLYDAIHGIAPLAITPEQALRVMLVMEAAFESHHSKMLIKTQI